MLLSNLDINQLAYKNPSVFLQVEPGDFCRKESMEEWRDIEGYEGLYQVSNMGRVKSLPRSYERKDGRLSVVPGRIRKCSPMHEGYLVVSLYDCGHKYTRRVHKIVAETFIPNPEKKPQINHKNGKKDDNRVENLEWCTNSENQNHAIHVLGTKFGIRGEDNHLSKLTEKEVKEIRNKYVPRSRNNNLYTLAKEFHIHPVNVWNIIHRNIWAHI